MLPRYRVDDTNKKVISKKKSNNKRKTTEQYKEELINKNICAQVLEEYVNANIPILHKFPCGHINKVSPSSILRGSKCLQCKNINSGNCKRKTTEQYIQELKICNPNVVDVLEKYINARTPILHKFSCGHISNVLPTNILKGIGCSQCKYKELGNKKRKSHSQYVEEVHKTNPNINIIGKYESANKRIHVQCSVCSHIWNPVAITLIRNNNPTGCPKCANAYTISHEEFIARIKDTKNKNIDIIGKYTNAKTHIKCICKECGNIFSTTPYQIEIGRGCKKCADKKRGLASRKPYDIFISEVKLQNPNVEIIGEYITSHDHIETKCLICGTIWTPIADSLLRGYGCPCCKSSKLESKVEHYLKNNNMEYIHPAKFDNLIGVGGRHLSYDFYLPQYNLLIECQGAQHERPVEYFGGIKKFVIQKIHDTRKRKYAHDNNINLLEIWYYEENKIDKLLTQTLNNLKSESVETVIPA